MQRADMQHLSVLDPMRAYLSILRSRFSVSAWRRRAKHRRELWALYGAEDRILKDIGITREEIKDRLNQSGFML